MATPPRPCRGYRSTTYDQGPHLVPDDAEHWYTHKPQCKACYLAYAADWRAKRAGMPVTARTSGASGSTAARATVLDGVAALTQLLRRAGYPSVVAAVAEHAIFLHPDTVAQTGGAALFLTVRDFAGRGAFGEVAGRRVLLDDNSSPTDAFLWSARLAKGPDVQFNHVWAASRDPDAYTALWNLCVTPAFLAKATDGSGHPEVQAALRYHAFRLYGCRPAGAPEPPEPAGYATLSWAPHPPAVANLEREVRARLVTNRKSRTAIACREVGWLFSQGRPDPTV